MLQTCVMCLMSVMSATPMDQCFFFVFFFRKRETCGRFFDIYYKGHNFCDTLFDFLCPKPLLTPQGVYSKRKEVAPKREQFISFLEHSILEERQNNFG